MDIIYGWNTFGDQLLQLPHNHLKWIQSISAGIDYMPLAAIKQQGILLTNTSGIHAEPIAEFVLGYLLAFSRGILASTQAQQQHRWVSDALRDQVFNLSHSTIAIFGTGHIGTRIAHYCHSFAMTTIGFNTAGHSAPEFDATFAAGANPSALQSAKFIVNALPLTAKTTGFFEQSFFEQLTGQPLFINVGRGPSVDTAALRGALDQHKLAGAVLDVLPDEPLAPDATLWDQPNLWLSPHISGGFEDYGAAAFAILFKNLQAYLADGQLIMNQVDLDKGY
ncbi:D-3-phosphoglycerate dehydrogenase [Agrilactobacillus composti DSM 18527 = JCM 14202]|uniref:NAD(P)-dependent oxidoreductase n=1 Tax=Agrilactobacillus composti TaxID=398555 RepID=UPI00042E02CD|nr:NAD(P)-dependent oxidoreductase [Agrilactobacillus composti]GAF41428.1 D-3-phosphoglycerate dehydrogenase [Agrilactobacillus composti DSM 18527 = JCM 14202]